MKHSLAAMEIIKNEFKTEIYCKKHLIRSFQAGEEKVERVYLKVLRTLQEE